MKGCSWPKAIIIAVSGLYISTSLGAGAPVSYGQWTASGGAITDTACGGGVNCNLIAEDNGFRYEFVETPDGKFSRMILTEAGATGNMSNLGFASENFAPFLQRSGTSGDFVFPGSGLISQGVASQQVLRDASMESSVELQRGFARDLKISGLTGGEAQAAEAWGTKLFQTNSDAGMSSGFSALVYNEVTSFPAANPDSDEVRGKAVDVWQTVTDTGTGEKQDFDFRTREGYKGWHWFLCCTNALTKGGSVTLDSSTVSWSAGGAVSAVWIGSDFTDQFGYQTVTGSTSATVTSLGDTGPFDWQTLGSDDLNWPLNPWFAPPDSSRAAPPAF